MDRWVLWLAQGFGVGRLPLAPGTFGSVVGVFWTLTLLAAGSGAVYVLGTVAGVALSIWAGGRAERILGSTDPSSVVLDEIAAVPVCFASWVAWHWCRTGNWLTPDDLFLRGGWLATLAVFAAFRFFDVLKPWPVRQSQSLPGGWGVTADDILAAVYVNLGCGLVWGTLAATSRGG